MKFSFVVDQTDDTSPDDTLQMNSRSSDEIQHTTEILLA